MCLCVFYVCVRACVRACVRGVFDLWQFTGEENISFLLLHSDTNLLSD